MIVKQTPDGLRGYITHADWERAQQYRREAAELEARARAVIAQSGRVEALASTATATIRRAAEVLAPQDPRPRFKVLLNPNAAKNSKTGKTSAVAPAHALRVHAQGVGPVSISENITLQKLK